KNNKPFYIPDFTDELHYETELIIKINRLGKNIASKYAHRYYTEIGLGVDFTARDLQRRLKTEGKPWEISKAFDNSAVIGDFLPIEQLGNVQDIRFRLDLNGNTVQQGHSADMIFPVDELIAYVSRFFTLKIGDIIFTGTPAGVGKVAVGDRLEGYILDTKMFDFKIK
ncbi:MAG: fumarylacetoacetate hydrolase family protein, partial [Paludibacter sp.]